jgi:NitT/TauT family transport system substrate-binding protein
MTFSFAARSLRSLPCWCATIAAVGWLAFGIGPVAAQEKLAVRFDFLPYGSHAPFYLAQEKGWFKEQGVDPTFDDGNGGAVTVQLVDAGKYDLGYCSFASAMVARDKGMSIKAIAGVLRKSDLGVLVDEKGPLHTPKDLEGRVIYFSPSSVETLFIDMWFKKNGVDKSKVNLQALEIGAKVSTYLSGGGDGMFVPLPIYTIRHIPRLSRGITFADYGLPLPGFGVIASDNAIKTKPKAIAGFVAALQRAWAGIHDRTMIDEAVQALLKNRPQSKLDPEYIREQLEAVIPYMDTPATAGKPLFWQSPDDWAAGVKVSEEAGVIQAGAKPSDFYTNDFIPKSQ